jgi:branched-chain amino acid transport system substrate-binding protein
MWQRLGVASRIAICAAAGALVPSVGAHAVAELPRASLPRQVTVGEVTTLSGPAAEVGRTALQGVELAVATINAEGGLLGRTVRVESADDDGHPATGAVEAQTMIVADHIAAMFGPASSAVAAAEETVATEYRTPLLLSSSSDIDLLTTDFTPYAFQVVPNTVMQARAVAGYLARELGPRRITLGTVAPNTRIGEQAVTGFIQALEDRHVAFKIVSQQFPPRRDSSFAPYLAALVAAHPDYVFDAQSAADLVEFTRQAVSRRLFKHTRVIAMYSYSVAKALGRDVPVGAIGFDNAPFWLMKGPAISRFISRYRARFGDPPSQWAIMAYTAVQCWAGGVRRAHSFSGSEVARALSGATISTIRGPITLRACDHQARVGEWVGTISSAVNRRYGVRLFDTGTIYARPRTVMVTCAESRALRGGPRA